MKKYSLILIILFLAFAVNSFACDYCPDPVTGEGHFDATVIIPISFTYVPSDGDSFLGTFVVCSTAYSLTSIPDFQFIIAGQPNYTFHYKIMQSLTDDANTGASITLTWKHDGGTLTVGYDQTATLHESGGKFTIKADPGTFTTGSTPGPKSFTQHVIANYQGGL
ncbi:MAG: hypothetical protein EPN82_04555 [Bacteroidetes bacterium]|nr:MAG: hypothetical protein EPN82_04555 [Bacteroidota bacterium]